jgi:Aldehyde dehydrogenase family
MSGATAPALSRGAAHRRRPDHARVRRNARSCLPGDRPTERPHSAGIANDSPYGLNAFVQTTDLGRAHRVARQLEAGSVWINQFSDISPQGPYGGYKQSGFGRTGGLEGLHEFMQVKNIRIGMQ